MARTSDTSGELPICMKRSQKYFWSFFNCHPKDVHKTSLQLDLAFNNVKPKDRYIVLD